MKTERRHELQSNELAQVLGRYHSAIKPYLPWIGSAVLFFAVVWLAMNWLGQSRQRQLHAGWSDFVRASKAMDANALRQVAARFPRGPAAARSLYRAGVISLQSGTNQLLFERADGLEQLEQARKDLEAALNAPFQDPFLAPQARLALAQVFEALNDLDLAKEQYERVVADFSDSSFAITAKRRLEFLQTTDAIAFSDWFAKQRIERPASASTSGWTPQGPTANDDLPVSRDLLLPSVDALERSIYDSDLGLMTPPTEGEKPPTDGTGSEATGPGDEGAADPSSAETPPAANEAGREEPSDAPATHDDPTSG